MNTKKTLFCFLFALISLPFALSNTILNTGDLLFLYINSTSADEFAFVTLIDLEAGTKIYFTDKGVSHQSTTLRSSEGIGTYTVPTGGLKAGAIITYDFDNLSADFSFSGSLKLSTSGDQLTLFQDSNPNNAIPAEEEPKFIFAINLATTTIDQTCDATNTNTSGVPSGLTPTTFGGDTGTYLALGKNTGCRDEEDRVIYTGSLSFTTKNEALQAISHPTNWKAESNTASADYIGYEAIIKGTANIFGLPEIQVLGNAQEIMNNDFSPDLADNTDFGNVSIFNETISKTFTIKNTGTGTLMFGSDGVIIGVNSGNFTITQQAAKGIIANGSTTLTVTFDPSSSRIQTDTIKIQNDDADENPFSFLLQGTGVCSMPIITLQPKNTTACIGSNTNFSTKATTQNDKTLKYQWQISKDNGATFNNLSDAGIYDNTDNKKLKLTQVSTANNGEMYRVIIKERIEKDTCQSISDAVKLTVPNISMTETISHPTCANHNDGAIRLNITGSETPFTYSWSNGGTGKGFSTGLRAGQYSLTATDADGCSATNAFTLNSSTTNCPAGKGPCTNLYFSKYIEGSGFNKALEIYNPSLQTVNLKDYSIHIFNNGTTTASYKFSFGNINLNPKATFVLAHTKHDLPAISAAADVLLSTGSVINFNGDDALILLHNQDTLDAIGVIGIDPGSNWKVKGTNATNGTTADFTLVRNPTINVGQPDWNAGVNQEWQVFPKNTTTDLGTHNQAPCSGNYVLTQFNNPAICISSSKPIAINYNCFGIFNPNNQFIAQLSDEKGNFTTPINIGTNNSHATTGKIIATLPPSMQAGTAYRVRVIASNPVTIGADNGRNLIIAQSPEIVGKDTTLAQLQAIDLNTLIQGTTLGKLEYGSTFGNWTSKNIVTPSTTTTYYFRDSMPTTGCMDTAKTVITMLKSAAPTFNYEDTDGDGTPDFGDPCSCTDTKNTRANGQFLFHDVFTINSLAGENWTLTVNDGEFLQANGTPYPLSTPIPPISAGSATYQIEFYHRSSISTNFSVSRDGGSTNFPQVSSVCVAANCLPAPKIPTFSQWGLLIFGLLLLNICLSLILEYMPTND